MSFESSRGSYAQQHFEILEIDLPVITGACTINGEPGYGTPLSCDEAWEGEYHTYKFTRESAPIMDETRVFRCIKSISEKTPEIKSGKGLSSRGSVTIVVRDFVGDPNPDAPAVNGTIKEQGTFFGKLYARQVVAKKKARLKLFRGAGGGGVNFNYSDSGAQIRHYLMESIKNNGNGTWTISMKDELSMLNKDEKVWPVNNGGYLRQAITEASTTLEVDPDTDYLAAKNNSANGVFFIRVGDEFIKVTDVSDSGTASATLTVERSATIYAPGSGVLLTLNEVDEHDSGDEVFLCQLSDNERIDDLLYRMLVDSGLDPVYINLSDWQTELDDWLSNIVINTIWSTSEDLSDQIDLVLANHMLDMWFDQVARKVRLSAVSSWKGAVGIIEEGRQIKYQTLRIKPQEELRVTRAIAVYGKKRLADSDDVENYRKADVYSLPNLTAPELYGEHKDIQFDPSHILNAESATLLTRRTVNRFSAQPEEYSWQTDERWLDFKVGDVVDIISSSVQDFAGNGTVRVKRAQITSVTPNYDDMGRTYRCTALTYQIGVGGVGVEPGEDGSYEVVYDGGTVGLNRQFNLFTELDSPRDPLTFNIIFKGTKSGSANNTYPAITAGNFPAGTVLNIILTDGADLQAYGGKGGDGRHVFRYRQKFPWVGDITSIWQAEEGAIIGSGESGGTVFESNGVTCNIYLSGPTPSVNYPTADGYIRAPGGGGGAGSDNVNDGNYETDNPYVANAGGGGAGRTLGTGGKTGVAYERVVYGNDDVRREEWESYTGQPGYPGDENGNGGTGGSEAPGSAAGNGGGWGEPGQDGLTLGGAAGSGIRDPQGTVTLFGSSATRYINGNGNLP